ncbi:MAG: lactate racemase domain-containing protein [Spirochaetales bacterium]|nr:lactate racemase domain-containing protein [Spirochaetales bacterium]
MIYYAQGSPAHDFSSQDLREALYSALEKLGNRHKVLAIPPDFTRFHSRTGELTEMAWQFYGDTMTDILPALGTHAPMSPEQIRTMYGETPLSLFREHHWKEDLVTLGEVPASFIKEVSEGKLNFSWPAQVNRLLTDGGHDLILSLGQVVPHEIVGMANYTKNIFVGTGGEEAIHKSHFLGAVYGMERIMGKADTPVRRVLNYGADHFAGDLPIVYVLTVVSPREDGSLALRGLFIGDDEECYLQAAALSARANLRVVEKPIKKCVVYLDPAEFHSTWLGNKAIYRTRMALADGAELIVLAPGLKDFGEDKTIDKLIRKYGYHGTEHTLKLVESEKDLAQSLSAAAHLIHGSTEGRFKVTYCPGQLSREEIEKAGYGYGDLGAMESRYDRSRLKEGWNNVGGEEIFFVSHPALGLWTVKE